MNLLNTFLDNSSLVQNQNILMSFDEAKKMLDSSSSQYIYSKSFNISKIDVEFGEIGINEAYLEADFGISSLGSVVIECSREDIRLASMLSEKLNVILFESKIKDSIFDIKEFLKECNSKDNSYIAFITGASRTADIERVLTVGVHGPTSMNIIIIKEEV